MMQAEGSLERVARLQAIFHERADRIRSLAGVGDVRVLGGVLAIELVAADGAGLGYLEPVGPRLAAAFLKRGLLLRPLGDVLYFMPPYAITDEEAHWSIDQIEDVLKG